MFTIEQINEPHTQLGSAKTLPVYVRALKALGLEQYASFLADGHSEYFAKGGHRVVSPAAHAVLHVAENGHRETFLQHLRRHELQPDDLFMDVQRPGAELDREVDCGHRQDDYDGLR